MTRPGDRLRAFAARVFDARTMERVIDPAVADLRIERRLWLGYLALIKVIVMCGLGGAMQVFQSWSDDERATLGRAAGVSAIALPLLTALFAWPLFRIGALSGRVGPVGVALTLLPFALGLSIPVALTCGIAFGLGGRTVSRRLVQAVVLVALVSSCASVVNAGWIAPAANQMFRASRASEAGLAPESVRPNASEMSSPELSQYIRRVSATGQASPAEIRTLETAYASRWAMAFSPIALAMFMLSVVGCRVAVDAPVVRRNQRVDRGGRLLRSRQLRPQRHARRRRISIPGGRLAAERRLCRAGARADGAQCAPTGGAPEPGRFMSSTSGIISRKMTPSIWNSPTNDTIAA